MGFFTKYISHHYIILLCFQVQGEDGIKLHIEKEHAVHIVNQSDSNITGSGLEQTLPLPIPLEVEITAVPTFKKIKRKWPQEKSHQCNLCPYETNRAERLRVHILGKASLIIGVIFLFSGEARDILLR